MTFPHAVNFSGTPGDDIIAENLTGANQPGITAQSGYKPTFDADIPPDYTSGNSSAEIDVASTSQTSFNHMALGVARTGETWMGFYFKILSAPTGSPEWLSWSNNSNTIPRIGSLRFNAGASTITLRDFNTARWTSPSLATNTWHRASVKVIPGVATGHRLRLYVGSNRHGTTPDHDSGNVAASSAGATDIGQFRFGHISGTSDLHYRIARIRIEATEPNPVLEPGSEPTDIRFATGDAWVAARLFSPNQGLWR